MKPYSFPKLTIPRLRAPRVLAPLVLAPLALAALVLAQIALPQILLAQADMPTSTRPPEAKPSLHAPARVDNKDIGFSFSLPGEWEVVEAAPALPAQQKQEEQKAPTADVRQGIACIDIPLTAQHGKPATVVAIVALPFACFGQKMKYDDLPGFGQGAAEGLKHTLDIMEPITASYRLVGHRFWIQRSKATAIGKTAPEYTVEIACTVLEKGAVCWLAQASDAAGLEAFEHSSVTLDGRNAGALVPKDVFAKNP